MSNHKLSSNWEILKAEIQCFGNSADAKIPKGRVTTANAYLLEVKLQWGWSSEVTEERWLLKSKVGKINQSLYEQAMKLWCQKKKVCKW